VKSIVDTLAENSFFNLIGAIANMSTRFAVSAIVARLLGPSQMGVYSLLIFIVGIAETFTNLGLQNLAIKYVSECAEEGQKNRAGTILVYVLKVKICTTVLAGTVLVLISGTLASFYGVTDLRSYIIFYAIALIPSSLGMIFQTAIQGFQRYRILAVRNTIIGPLQILLTVIALKLGLNIQGLIGVTVVLAFLDVSIYYWYLSRRLNVTLEYGNVPDQEIKSKLFRYNWQVAIIVMLDAIVWQRSEVFFLGKLSAQAEVAFYSMAYNLSSWLVAFLPGIFTSVLFPMMSRLYGENDRDSIRKLYLVSTRYLLILSIPTCIGGMLLSQQLVSGLYGDQYLPMVSVLRILMLSASAGVIASPGASVLYSTERQSIIMKVGSIIAIGNITLDLILIPKFGAMGAALANSSAQISGVIIGTLFVCRSIRVRFPFESLLKITISSGIMILNILLLMSISNSLGILLMCIITSAFVYFYCLIRIKTFKESDINILSLLEGKLPLVLQILYKKIILNIRRHAIADTI
jgi:O-antigen/teichoic acid export membrane protein